ncbi:hypothetical protein [Gottfriedia luciferensis]|uniref:hypothetical protein n=1 Tax=Gottfriedia luciferensis TaxID=178774 RepID=UPI000B43DF11|nr:hypothetical protein [Gottfriedia luciferensis]
MLVEGVIEKKKFEKDYETQIEIKDIEQNKIIENLRGIKFKILERIEINNCLIFIIEKFSLT